MRDIKNYIENTVLKPDVTEKELTDFFEVSKKYNVLGVCINPIYVKRAKEFFGDTTKIVTVVGFPLGANLSEIKAFEAQKAVRDGADEIDMVINVSALKNKNYSFIKEDINQVVKASEGKPVKVILETDLLTKEEIIKACEICVDAGASFVKTSTALSKTESEQKSKMSKLCQKRSNRSGLKSKPAVESKHFLRR
jgi:deoxyribose-phosphate aldolase